MAEKISFSPDQIYYINECLKVFNVALKNASIYTFSHSTFLKSLAVFKEKLSQIEKFIQVLEIDILPDSVCVSGQSLAVNEKVYKELGQYLHRKKIKQIKIFPGVEEDSLKEMIRRIVFSENIFSKNIKGITIEKLDYSFLLSGQGKHSKNVWDFIFGKSSVEDRNTVVYVRDNIDLIMQQLSKNRELLSDIDLSRILKKVKETGGEKEEIAGFVKKFISSVFKFDEDYVRKFIEVYKNSGGEELTEVLNARDRAEVLASVFYDTGNFDLIITSLLGEIFKGIDDDYEMNNELADILTKFDNEKKENILKTFSDLLKGGQKSKFLTNIYEGVIASSYLGRQKKRGSISLTDEREVSRNFLYMLLNLIIQEKDASSYNVFMRNLFPEIEKILGWEDFAPIRDTFLVLAEEKSKADSREEIKKVYQNWVYKVISLEFMTFLLGRCRGDKNMLEKIAAFVSGNIPYYKEIWKTLLFSPEFSGDRTFIINNLGGYNVLSFLKNILSNNEVDFYTVKDLFPLIEIDEVFYTLEDIFNKKTGGEKLAVLDTIGKIKNKSKDFLTGLLDDKFYPVRYKAAEILLLCEGESAGRLISDKLIGFPNPLGLKDALIIDNLHIIKNLKIKEACPLIKKFVRISPFLLLKKRRILRKKSKEILKKLRGCSG